MKTDYQSNYIPQITSKRLALSETEVSERYPVSRAWLQRCRWRGDGPPFTKIGHRVIYFIDELDMWFRSGGQSNELSK